MKKNIAIILMTIGFILPLKAQSVYNGQMHVSSELKQVEEVMYVTIDINFDHFKLGKERYMIVTPILSNANETEEVYLSPILINGKTRAKVHKRGLALNKQSEPAGYFAVLNAGKEMKKIEYVDTTPFEPWMKNAQLKLMQFICGCGGNAEELYTDYLNPDIQLQVEEVIPPKVTQVVEIKEQVKEVEAFIEYPINKSAILENFGDNKNKLAQLKSGLEEVFGDENMDISRIVIMGYASPEGPADLNRRLSEERAEALKEYMLGHFREVNPSSIQVVYGGEDWKRLEELIEASAYTDKDQILSVIRNTDNPNTRKAKLKSLNNGASHRKMAKEIYPQIRRATFYVYYTVKEKEVREVIEMP